MTNFEKEDISANCKEDCLNTTNNDDAVGTSRRKGTCEFPSVQISSSTVNMNYGSTDNESDLENSCWVEAWLDEHPEFFQAYLIRKGTRSMIDSWLVSHALPPGITATTLNNVYEEDLDDIEKRINGERSSTSLRDGDLVPKNSDQGSVVNNESSLGLSCTSIATNNIPIPPGAGNKVRFISYYL